MFWSVFTCFWLCSCNIKKHPIFLVQFHHRQRKEKWQTHHGSDCGTCCPQTGSAEGPIRAPGSRAIATSCVNRGSMQRRRRELYCYSCGPHRWASSATRLSPTHAHKPHKCTRKHALLTSAHATFSHYAANKAEVKDEAFCLCKLGNAACLDVSLGALLHSADVDLFPWHPVMFEGHMHVSAVPRHTDLDLFYLLWM